LQQHRSDKQGEEKSTTDFELTMISHVSFRDRNFYLSLQQMRNFRLLYSMSCYFWPQSIYNCRWCSSIFLLGCAGWYIWLRYEI